MGSKKGGKSSGNTSQGIVGTYKLGHTPATTLTSMLACLFGSKGEPRNRNNKTYDYKQSPTAGNEEKAKQRRDKKRAKRIAKKQAEKDQN